MIFSFQGAAKELLSLHVSVYGNYQILTITGLKSLYIQFEEDFQYYYADKKRPPPHYCESNRSHTYKIIICFSTLLETLETLHCHPYI